MEWIHSKNRGIVVCATWLAVATGTTLPALSATQTAGPSATAVSAEAPYNSFKCDWKNSGNVTASDGADASVTDKRFDSGAYTHVLYATGFGFSIPAGATITGIEVNHERRDSAGAVSDALIQLVKGGTRGGDNKSLGAAWPGTDTVATFGGSSDLWGQTWTPAEINAANFGVAIAATATANNSDAHIDYLEIVVHFTGSAPTVDNDGGATNVLSGSATMRGEVTSTGGDDPVVTIYWGPTDGGTVPSSWSNSVNLGVQSGSFSWDQSGLSASTVYYYRTYATNSAGDDWANATTNFTTLALSAPTVDNNGGASKVKATTATLNGQVTDSGGQTPSVTVYWGPTDGGTAPSSWSNAVSLGSEAGFFSTDITGLSTNTTYYYRCYATNSAGDDWANSTTNFATDDGTPDAPTLDGTVELVYETHGQKRDFEGFQAGADAVMYVLDDPSIDSNYVWVTWIIDRRYNDNSYGSGKHSSWDKGHTWDDLLESDMQRLDIENLAGELVVDASMDYMDGPPYHAAYPTVSGYDADMDSTESLKHYINGGDWTKFSYRTSIIRNLNDFGYWSLMDLTAGSPPWSDEPNYVPTSTYSDWEYSLIWELRIERSVFVTAACPAGGIDPKGTYPVQLHASPAKLGNGLVQAEAAVGDLVWLDMNRDGIQDVGEPGIANVTLSLYADPDGDGDVSDSGVVRTTTTDAGGRYLFGGLGAGNYVIEITDIHQVLTNYTHISGSQSTNTPTASIELDRNEYFTEVDFGYAPDGGAIGDYVWFDTNNDGAQDFIEVGIGGVTLNLLADYDGDSNYTDVVASTITSDSGWYMFTGLTSGYYKVDVTDTGGILGTFSLTSGPQSMTDPTEEIFLSPNEIFLNADFGYYRTKRGEIGDIVWRDHNRDGTRDAGEEGIGDVTVNIINDTDGDGEWDAGELIIATATTETNGTYLFRGLSFDDGDGDADYLVWVNDVQDVLRRWRRVTGPSPGANDNSQYNPYSVTITTAATTNLTADFGYMFDQQDGLIGDFVWYDLNSNGVQELTEPGIPGVLVDCWTLDNQNNRRDYIGQLATDHNGYYFYPNLDSKYQYEITVADENFLPGGVLENMTCSNQADNQDENGAKLNSFANYTDLTLDFGYYFTGTVYTVGDLIWNDMDGDGHRDAGEPGFSNVTVSCYLDSDGDGALDGGEPLLQTATTGTDGSYLFTSLTPNDYIVKVTDINGMLVGYTLTDGIDDTNDESQVSPYAVTVVDTNVIYADFGFVQPTNQLLVDVGVVKTVDDPAPPELDRIQYTMVVSNNGPDKATGVQWTDILPNEVTYDGYSSTTGSYDSGSGIWDVGEMEVGATETLYIWAIVNTNTTNMTITNEISLTGIDQEDTNPDNNRDEAIIQPVPLAVILADFDATVQDGKVVVEWRTASELNTAGFFLLRKAGPLTPGRGSSWVPVNKQLVPGLLTSPQGGTYRVLDEDAAPDTRHIYKLIEMETGGKRNEYGPFKVTPTQPDAAEAGAPEHSTVPGIGRRSPGMRVANAPTERMKARRDRRLGERRASAASGPSIATATTTEPHDRLKIVTRTPGLYYVSASFAAELAGISYQEAVEQLAGAGFRLTNKGRTIAYLPVKHGFYFYAEAHDSIFSDDNVYWLKAESGATMSTADAAAVSPAPTGISFPHTVEREESAFAPTAYFSDPRADFWVWDYSIAGLSGMDLKDYSFVVPSPRPSPQGEGADALLHLVMQGGTDTDAPLDHHIEISINGSKVADLTWDGTEACETDIAFDAAILNEGSNTLTVKGVLEPGVAYSIYYMNRFAVTYPRAYEAVNNSLHMTDGGNQTITVTGLTSPDTVTLDITKPYRPVILSTTPGPGSVSFKAEADKRYFAAAWTAAAPPVSIRGVFNTGLEAAENEADYLVIAPADLVDAAAALTAHRATQGLRTMVVNINDIYDTFNQGIVDPLAIRTFLAHTYTRWDAAPRYIVLCGGGTYDYKDYTGTGGCLIPPALINTHFGLCSSDSLLADFDENGVPEMAVGRLPVLSADELDAMLAKIRAYEDGAAWKDKVVMAADEPDKGGDFDAASDYVAELVPYPDNVQKIYMSTMPVDEARAALQDSINNGCGLLHYVGHAAVARLADEGLLESADLDSLSNADMPPVMCFMSCSVGRFGIPGYDSLSTELAVKADGGAAAVWAPVGWTLLSADRALARALFNGFYVEKNARIGDSILHSLAAYRALGGNRETLAVYALLGDPATAVFEPAPLFEDWRKEHFTSVELEIAGISGGDADPDGDGSQNLMEYALGRHPRQGNDDRPFRAALVRLLGDDSRIRNHVDVRFRRLRQVQGLKYIVEMCHDLKHGAWRSGPEHTEQISVTTLDGSTEEVRVRLKQPLESKPIFVRLKIAVE